MVDLVLWRRLTQTDFNAMHGKASPYGEGGGAMHISLGVQADEFPIDRFLRSGKRTTVTIATTPQRHGNGPSELTFATNADRRGGEWVIRDQYTHRHPAWSPQVGFPKKYDPNNPPYILVFRVGNTFHVQFSTARGLLSFASALPEPMLSARKGILPTTPLLLRRFHVQSKSTLELFDDEIRGAPSPSFDPKDIEDGRRRVLREVYRRQGQQTFRRKLMKAYGTRCAISGEATEWVLEAAHITPYLGTKTNAVTNGLLLRADIHTLFDLALISVEPDERKIRVSSTLAGTQYAKFQGKKLAEPRTASLRPSTAALREHFSGFLP